MEFFAHRAHVEPALQLPVGGECHLRHDFIPNTIAAQQIFTTWTSTANTILPRHPLGPFYWLVVRQDDHHGLSVLSPWPTSTAICFSYGAQQLLIPRLLGVSLASSPHRQIPGL